MNKYILFFLLILFAPSWALAQRGPGFFAYQRQTSKENTRWTLADYLAQKQKIRLMDMWLAIHRQANLFEMALGGGALQYDLKIESGGVKTKTAEDASAYQLDLFFSIFGLHAEYEETEHDTRAMAGAVAVRVFGMSSQGTNLTLRYGLRNFEDRATEPFVEWQNQFGEAELNFYLFKFFGLQGNYRHYLADKANNGVELSGHRTTAGVFFDFSLVRLFGSFFQEQMEYKVTDSMDKKDREGFTYGMQLFF